MLIDNVVRIKKIMLLILIDKPLMTQIFQAIVKGAICKPKAIIFQAIVKGAICKPKAMLTFMTLSE